MKPPDSAPETTPPPRKRVLIVDDHPVFRRGIAALIGEQDDLAVCGEAESVPTALEAMRRLKPDVVLMDVTMPGTNGIELIKMALAEQPKLSIIVLSMHSESLYALRALRAGAKGYVMKAEALNSVVTALRKVLNDGIYVSPKFTERLIFKAIRSLDGGMGSPVDKLSDRELEVLQLMGKGFGTSESANALNLSIKTIETHRAHIKEKLGFKDPGEMKRFAIDWVAQEQG
jgi:DNA-binding NarL/FixJ family response regulator